MKPIKYTYASPKRKRSIELPRSQNSSSPPPISVSTVDKPEITVRKVLKRSLSVSIAIMERISINWRDQADSDVVERLLKKRKQEFDTVDQINLVEENRHFAIEYGKEDLTEETKGPFWNDLPLELFSKVAELLPHSDIVTLATACRFIFKTQKPWSNWKPIQAEAHLCCYRWKSYGSDFISSINGR